MPTVITLVAPAQRLSRASNHVGQNSMKTTPSGGSILRGHQHPSGMLFIRNENGSHNPHEAMAIDDFMLGVRVLADTISHL